MNEIIKFPERLYCDGCGKPLVPGEGIGCPTIGCDTLGCRVCVDGSIYCLDHISADPNYGR